MTIEELSNKTVTELKKIAKELNVESVSKYKKEELVDILSKVTKAPKKEEREEVIKEGILEVNPEGFGFLRSENYQTGEEDIYVSQNHIKQFNLRTGDWVKCIIRPPRQDERFGALIYIKTVNNDSLEVCLRRTPFDDLKPIYPNEQLHLEHDPANLSTRIIDLVSPIGKGQRGIIVAPPKAGKTTLLKDIANAITKNHKETYVIVLLIDERPEEVSDMKDSICGENVDIIYSTFDERPENHKKVTEMVLERAKRLVEHQKDVVILLDSLTRLTRANNLVVPPTGRTLSGGIDPSAFHMPKRLFGAARNIEKGGSLTIIASALVETGSKMDDVIFEEFKGTGNMELVLDRRLAERRIFPAINILSSGTRKEELLLSEENLKIVYELRKILASAGIDKVEEILQMLRNAKNNQEFLVHLKEKMKIYKA